MRIQIRIVPTNREAAAILVEGQWIEGAPDGRTGGTAGGYSKPSEGI
jgi:hypothetical protein